MNWFKNKLQLAYSIVSPIVLSVVEFLASIVNRVNDFFGISTGNIDIVRDPIEA